MAKAKEQVYSELYKKINSKEKMIYIDWHDRNIERGRTICTILLG